MYVLGLGIRWAIRSFQSAAVRHPTTRSYHDSYRPGRARRYDRVPQLLEF